MIRKPHKLTQICWKQWESWLSTDTKFKRSVLMRSLTLTLVAVWYFQTTHLLTNCTVAMCFLPLMRSGEWRCNCEGFPLTKDFVAFNHTDMYFSKTKQCKTPSPRRAKIKLINAIIQYISPYIVQVSSGTQVTHHYNITHLQHQCAHS